MRASRKYRSINRRVIIIFSSMLLMLAIVTVIILNTILLRQISYLEDKNVSASVIQVQHEINIELQRLCQSAGDWAGSADIITFMDDPQENFASEKLGQSAFRSLDIDFLVLADADGQYAYAAAAGPENLTLLALPGTLTDYLDHSPLIGENDPDYPLSGMILLPEGPVLIAARPVLPSGSKGPANGTLIIGEYLDDTIIRQIARKLKLELRIEPIGQASERQPLAADDHLVVQAIDADTIAGQATLYNMDSDPILRMTVLIDREISRTGRKGILYSLIALLAFSLLLISGIWFYFDRTIIVRLKNISAAITRIGREQLFSNRLPPEKPQDEITIVSQEINAMLEKLEAAQLALLKSQADLRSANVGLENRISQRTADLEATNQDLQNEIAERQKAQEGIRHLAYHDPLTSLPNRLMFTEYLNHAVKLTERSDSLLAVIFMDLDSFKMINDTMGHASGDRLLQEVAERLTATLRQSDVIARIGGDEFIALIENLGEPNDVRVITDKILQCFQKPIRIDKQDFFITTSIGVALFPSDGQDADSLIKNADIAMYKAKELGKNQSVFCSPIMKSAVMENVSLTNLLHWALARNELELYYQPQIRCENNRISGVEALLRWHHPEMGMISPAKFIPLAEQSGVIIPIGEWVLRTACRQCARWHEAGYGTIRMGVNLSIKQFQCTDLVRTVADILEETGLDPAYLELEITESIALKGNHSMIGTLQALKDMGVSIAVDDFGTEYSSLSYLKQLPIKALKIALPFVQGIDVSPKDEAITKAVITLAKSLGLELIAEGVETESQLDFLAQRLCDEVQGYYYYKPMTSDQLEEVLRRDDAQHQSILMMTS